MNDKAVRHGDSLHQSAVHLLHRAGQFANDIFLLEAGHLGLTPRQYTVLATVGEDEGLTQTDLVMRTGIDRSTLADIVGRLVARGLLRRRRAKRDSRAYQVKLTERGRSCLNEVQPCARAADNRLLSRLPPGRREEFLDSLSLIVGEAD